MHERLQHFVREVERAMATDTGEAQVLPLVRAAMRKLVAVDDWLPPDCAQPHATYYQQHLLYLDREGRFSVVSFVWGPGQRTPIHDHTVWGVIGILRGAEDAAAFRLEHGRPVQEGSTLRLQPGDVEAVSPAIGDIHRVGNAFGDRVSISIHCYGADIGRLERHVFDEQTGQVKSFFSGYANA